MQAIIEHFVVQADDQTARAFIQIVNAITLASDEAKLREYLSRVNTGEQDK